MTITPPITELEINNVTYPYPLTGSEGWGQSASAWATAVTNGMLQKSGGLFTLTADVNFGVNFGLISKYYKTDGTNISLSGSFRLGNTQEITWRDSTNTFDHTLSVSAGDELEFDGVPIGSGGVPGSPLSFTYTGTGSTTVYAITGAQSTTSNGYFVFVSGIQQQPTTDYIVNVGLQQLTFLTAPINHARIVIRTIISS